MERLDDMQRRSRGLAALLCVVAVVGAGAPARAQLDDVHVSMSSSNDAPAVGEQFQIQIEARLSHEAMGELEAPDFAPLRVIGQSGIMRSQQITAVFGAPPRIEIREVIAFAVVADRPGIHRIPAAHYRSGRRSAASEELVIKVGGDARPVDPSAPPPVSSTVAAESAAFDRQVFVRAVVDRTEAYVGQQITLTVYLYLNDQLPVRDARASRAPSTNGFWVQDLRSPQSPQERDHQYVRGVGFQVYVLRRLALFPLHAGSLEAGATEMTVEVGDPLAAMMGQSTVLTPGCAPIHITVRPLPQGAPADTLVGRASLSADLDRQRVRTGEALTLTANVRGEGSLRDVMFATPVVPGLRFDAPSIDDRIETPSDVVGGERHVRWQVVPLQPGRFVIPPLTLSTFDPATERLEALHTSALSIEAFGDAIADDDADAGIAGEEGQNPGEAADEVRFGPPSRTTALRRRTDAISSHRLFAPSVILAPTLAMLVWASRSVARAWGRRRATVGAPTPGKPLADAKRALAAGDAAAFYGATATALHRALEASLGAKTTGMPHAELRSLLAARGADADLVARTIDELESADFARFSAAGSAPDEMKLALDRTRALVDRIARARLAEVES